MNAPEDEQDVKLQRASPELLSDFDSSLKPFLWRASPSHGELSIRKRVRTGETDRLISLLSPHQENPQLLDPHLAKFLRTLSDAFLEYTRSVKPPTRSSADTALLIPTSEAVCKLLYTFCKIRGEKVIVRFFSAEPKNLELLLSAIETADNDGPAVSDETGENEPHSRPWSWEERYITILWLSHLLLNPFDLASISSTETMLRVKPSIPRMEWPLNLPGVALRVVPLAIKHLACAGKERDAAKALLVRISMRKDMQELGLLHALVQWALSCLQASAMAPDHSPYYYIGILSYLGGVLASSISTSDMDPYLTDVFRTVEAVSDTEYVIFKSIYTSALARKTIIKVLRTTVVLVLRPQYQLSEESDLVETTIGHMLAALADNDTPVRLAASKALSVMTLKMPTDMATQVVGAVLSALDQNVLVTKDTKSADLSSVNALEWHGLILTLSHLLYRRSPPAVSLPAILHSLLIGLTFEQRSSSGSSVGINVRDAACFGIWALARRYSTKELLGVETVSVPIAVHRHRPNTSMIQVLATELVVSASLDSAGNIRRGASAALQELIGRHPDTVDNGIMVVQVVDYHAVALRSRAVLEVAPKAALLSGHYQDALLNSLMGWRGAGDVAPGNRRTAATAVGLLVSEFQFEVSEPTTSDESPAAEVSTVQVAAWTKALGLIRSIDSKLKSLKARDADRRHGCLLSMAAVVVSLPFRAGEGVHKEVATRVLENVTRILVDPDASSYRKPELYAEGTSRLVSATCPILAWDTSLVTPVKLLSTTSFPNEFFSRAVDLLTAWLPKDEREVSDIETLAAITDAAVDMLKICNSAVRRTLVTDWISRISKTNGYLFAIVKGFQLIDPDQREMITKIIVKLWQEAQTVVETRVIILQLLTSSIILDANVTEFIGALFEGLDDYRTDGRGDIGSLVRVEALKASCRVFTSISWVDFDNTSPILRQRYFDRNVFLELLGRVLRLAGEKLDKVRAEARKCLMQLCRDPIAKSLFHSYSISSSEYFMSLLEYQTRNWLCLPSMGYKPDAWRLDIFEGIVSSADAGSEDLIRSSRTALVSFCKSNVSREYVAKALFDLAKKNQLNDRVLVPSLEVLSFLFDMGIMQKCELSWKSLCVLIQRAHYKSNNMRKLDACVRLYGGLMEVHPEACQKLTSMLLHPYPQIRNRVADVLFVTRDVGKGVNWLVAKKEDLEKLKARLE